MILLARFVHALAPAELWPWYNSTCLALSIVRAQFPACDKLARIVCSKLQKGKFGVIV
jgi:hypothetical protein